MNSLTRRSFVKRTATTAAVLSAASWNRVLGSNEAVRVGVIGFRGRGGDHIGGLSGIPGVRMAGLCDVDGKVLDAEVKKRNEKGEDVKGFTDMRKLFEDKSIDVVTTATPNHWHALLTVWACQAGKDVYCEKPVSHNVWEGRQAVNAARKYNRVVQTGTQSRSSHAIKEAVEWVQAGNLGKITLARGLCYKPRRSIGKVTAPTPIPPGIDYDLWCGPAPMVPLMRQNLHYDWHWVWDTGNGDVGNQGIHQMDIARWFLGEQELSSRVISAGGRLGYVDDGQTPNTQVVYHHYDRAPLIFEVRGLPQDRASQADALWTKSMDKFMGGSVAVVIHCEGGHVLVPSYSEAVALDTTGTELKRWKGAKNHYENWIEAVRARKPALLTADILEGHLSSALCHTGNVSYLLGSRMKPGEARERLAGFSGLHEAYDRMVEHLRRNEINLDEDRLALGAGLTMDPKTERFAGNDAANRLLTREYRKPYVVPEQV
ncbi:MAG: Gfo/Idh/MocA family protein [Limisphaerales bacterium]